MSIALSLLSLIPRVFAQNDPEVIVTHLVNYRNMDAAKCRNAEALLKQYYSETNAEWVEQIRQDEWIGTYDQIDLYNQGIYFRNRRDFGAAIDEFKKACDMDPLFWNARVAMGASYIQLRRYDEALVELDIAEGVNPGNPSIYNNRAFALVGKGRYRQAEEMYLKCIATDTTNIAPLIGLVSLYQTTRQEALYRQYLIEATERPDAPQSLVKQLGDYMLSKRQFPAAAEAYRRALEKGLDSAYVQRLLSDNPDLKRAWC